MHWLFTFNVPFGILAVWLALRSLPDTPRSGHCFDLVSAALNAATFGLLLVGLDGIGHGQNPLWVWMERLGGSIACVVFIRRQKVMVAVIFALTHGDIAAAVKIALAAASVCSGAACVINFLRLTRVQAV